MKGLSVKLMILYGVRAMDGAKKDPLEAGLF
jgi:hypothetical protein